MANAPALFTGITRGVIENAVDTAEADTLIALFPEKTRMNIKGDLVYDKDVPDTNPDPEQGNFPDAIKFFRINIMDQYNIALYDTDFTAQSLTTDVDNTPDYQSDNRTYHVEFENNKVNVGTDYEMYAIDVHIHRFTSSDQIANSSLSNPANSSLTYIDREWILIYLRHKTNATLVQVKSYLDSWHRYTKYDHNPGDAITSTKIGEISRGIHYLDENMNRVQSEISQANSSAINYLKDELEKLRDIVRDIQQGTLN